MRLLECTGPKRVRVFADKTNLSFDDAARGRLASRLWLFTDLPLCALLLCVDVPTQILDIDKKELGGTEQKLKFVKFQAISDLTVCAVLRSACLMPLACV